MSGSKIACTLLFMIANSMILFGSSKYSSGIFWFYKLPVKNVKILNEQYEKSPIFDAIINTNGQNTCQHTSSCDSYNLQVKLINV